MPEERELEKQLKIAAKTGKFIVGRREVMSGVKGSKLLVWSASANLPQQILDECKTLSVPAVRFNGNPVELGHACGIPFRVSVIAVKAAGDADLRPFSNSSDYMSLSQVVVPSPKVEEEPEQKKKEEPEKAPEKKRRAPRKKTTEPVEEKKEGDEPEKPKKTRKKASKPKKASKEETEE